MMKTKCVLLLLLILISFSYSQTRKPAVAGMFYPADPSELSSICKKYLDQAGEKTLQTKPFGIIVPHAGYVYSGGVAAYAYKEIQGEKYEAVVILSPSHIDYFHFASVYSGEYYETPLGKLPISKEIASKCTTKDKFIQLSTRGHEFSPFERGEHAIEVQLPFLQTVLGNVPIVPIIIGAMDWQVVETLGKKLGEIASNQEVLVIVSSDLSHYHSYSDCKEIDAKLISQLEQMDAKSFYNGLIERKYEACGGAPITSMLIAAERIGANSVKILKYANSGDVPYGDKSQVVGYLSAAIYKSENEEIGGENMNSHSVSEGELNKEEQKWVLELAENTVKAVVSREPVPEPINIPEIAKKKRGAFVTLEKNGQLRGCIGYVLPIYPLYKTIIDVATSAALRDPRFPPVNETELKDITVEVSVLTVPKTITNPNQIEVGKHGIIIKRDYYQGLLLPQVATEYGWDRETFLEQTCLKAGLPRDAWKDEDTEIQIFSAQVFNRETLKSE